MSTPRRGRCEGSGDGSRLAGRSCSRARESSFSSWACSLPTPTGEGEGFSCAGRVQHVSHQASVCVSSWSFRSLSLSSSKHEILAGQHPILDRTCLQRGPSRATPAPSRLLSSAAARGHPVQMPSAHTAPNWAVHVKTEVGRVTVAQLCLHPQACPGPGVGSLGHGILGLLPCAKRSYLLNPKRNTPSRDRSVM